MEFGVTEGVSMVGVDVAGATGTAAAGADGAMVIVGEVSDMAQVSVRPPSIHVALPRVNVVLVDTTSG
jgi:ABC-type transporter Mla maintaining outer membrane lipid asymmetry permease subunit MlaE